MCGRPAAFAAIHRRLPTLLLLLARKTFFFTEKFALLAGLNGPIGRHLGHPKLMVCLEISTEIFPEPTSIPVRSIRSFFPIRKSGLVFAP